MYVGPAFLTSYLRCGFFAESEYFKIHLGEFAFFLSLVFLSFRIEYKKPYQTIAPPDSHRIRFAIVTLYGVHTF